MKIVDVQKKLEKTDGVSQGTRLSFFGLNDNILAKRIFTQVWKHKGTSGLRRRRSD